MKHVDKKKFTKPNHHYSETFCDKIKTQGTVFDDYFNSLEISRFREGDDYLLTSKLMLIFTFLKVI